MKQTLTLVVAVLVAAGLIGCMVGETEHLIYLDPDGRVSWVVLERDVRSTDDDIDVRKRQENQFLAEVQGGVHPVAMAFDALLPRSVEWRLLRDVRPFSVWTEARFERADVLARTMLERIGVPARVDLWVDDEMTHLEAVILVGEAQEATPDDRVIALFDDPDAYAIRLTRGAFVAARGFVIEEGGTVARPAIPDENEASEEDPLVLSLSWVGE